ncbi:thiamine pyrophosphate-dependent dehydrogenase E1 component subunit alpha [Streptomyces sp. RY43-2]|uniref:Thiamine pyrophosphate-dependent dehydrogenase E1 component subunit alpha n=1 Tax=Streptomyces macrolidinus TaxID=2952607 RepID=A0ABT0ZL91_9ACTN|nr:thiamine pyrophosphate-dependent dehydrogenase E1 component subunit alpha [Streptomyces macrolidinus]MCN9244364.1 thiamine pyrophosphate-dependent dehydrogenase E1 component subunit alpha [Streptomyces macrolidinus]
MSPVEQPRTPRQDDGPADLADLLHAMVRIRVAEETIGDVYRDEQEMRTPVHFSIGQEATAVGVCAALRREDLVYGGHRCHAQYLAKGGDLDAMVAELYGRRTGCAAGRGGSVHLTDLEAGFGASSAILGEMIAVATGAAWTFAEPFDRTEGRLGRIAVTFFGDGASEEGVFHESLNFASLHRLPVLYVCENNQYSLSSGLAARQPAGHSITDRARGYGITARRLDGNDVVAVHEAAREAVRHCREGRGPYFLELDTYRWREHVGPNRDHEQGVRPAADVESWMRRCPVRRATEALRATDPGIDARVATWTRQARAEVNAAIDAAKASPFPAVSDLLTGTYAT